MRFSDYFRWELFRLGLDGLGRAIMFDSEPVSGDRSRGEHLRNGVGALLLVSSEVGFHRNLIASCGHLIAVRRHAAPGAPRADLRYGLAELRKAEPLEAGKEFAFKHPVAFAVATTAGVALAGSVGRTR
ncbi:MAG: hypothetical protein ACXVRU_13100 [Gaiellaceae bacterium]